MSAVELERQVASNKAADRQSQYYNGISYIFYTLPDGWIAIFEYEDGEYLPKIQAKDFAHAKSWCSMRERTNVPIAAI